MGKRVMIVDDSSFMRLMIRQIAEKIQGIEVVGEANDGLEAIELCKKCKPDIVTLDINMPIMDGIQALEELLKINPQLTIIMITPMGHEVLVRDALTKGAKEFIVKPFKKELVGDILKKYL